jgi:hypothetical protein
VTILDGGAGQKKIRIEVWDKSNGNAVVYDTQMGAPVTALPTTLLGGGNLSIHPSQRVAPLALPAGVTEVTSRDQTLAVFDLDSGISSTVVTLQDRLGAPSPPRPGADPASCSGSAGKIAAGSASTW